MLVRLVEAMIAKTVPYIGIGYVQVRLILAISVAVLELLIRGSIGLLVPGHRTLHRQQSRLRLHDLDVRPQPDAGDPAGTVHAFTVDPAVGLSLPVPRHADLGAIDRRGVPDDAHPTGRPRYHLKGNNRRRNPTQLAADRGLHADRCGHRNLVVPREAGLKRMYCTGGSFALRAGRSEIGGFC